MLTITKNDSKQEIANKLLERGIKDLEHLEYYPVYPIDENVKLTKATSYFGQIRIRSGEFGPYFEISISEYHFKNGIEAVRNTIYHELIHAIGVWNHGKEFKEMANEFDIIFNTDIRVSGSRKGYKLPKSNRKTRYILKCSNCKVIWKRKNKSKLVKNYQNYKCGSCGGKIIRIK